MSTVLNTPFYIDIDECGNSNVTGYNVTINGTAIGECDQECINTPGSYSCHCIYGYRLNADNHTCAGIIEDVL